MIILITLIQSVSSTIMPLLAIDVMDIRFSFSIHICYKCIVLIQSLYYILQFVFRGVNNHI